MSSTKQKDVIEEIKEIIRDLGKGHKQAQKEMKEIRERLKEQSKNIDKVNGNFDNKWGRFMEDLVKGDLINLLKDRKMDVIRVLQRVDYYRPDGTQEGEIDLIALNGKELVAFEIKTLLAVKDVDKFIKILNFFKNRFPEYNKKIIYGGVGYLDQREKASNYAESKGLFVIKAPGGAAKVSTITNVSNFKPKEFGD